MKAQVKAIMASAVVIALCLAAVGGVTYSWFSDSEQNEITVNAAEIDLKLDTVSGTLKSHGLAENTLTASGGSFPIGGTVSMGTITPALDSTTYRITVDQMAPGDSMVLVLTGTLKNTIRTSIITSATITEIVHGVSQAYGDDKLTVSTPACTVMNAGVPVGNLNDIPATSTEKNVTVTTTIALDTSAGNNYQTRHFMIDLTVTAIQMNYDGLSDVVITDPDQSTSIPYRGGGESGPTVTIPADQFSVNDNVSLTVETADATQAANDYDFVVVSGSTPVAAIDLSLTVNGTSKTNFTSAVLVQVPVPVGFTAADLTVKYVDNAGDVSSEVIEIVSCVDGILTFKTTHFSKFVVMGNDSIVAYNKDTGVRYDSLQTACSSAGVGETVVMLRDVVNTNYSSATPINLGAGMILDGKGHMISGNVSVNCKSAGATIQNVRFIGIHNNTALSSQQITHYGFASGSTGNLTALYASGLTGTLIVTNCIFDGTDWDSIQITPKAGSVIYICDNVFSDNGKVISPTGHSTVRQIHIQSSENVDFTVTVKNNKFNTGHGLNQTALEVYYPADLDKVDISGNYIDNMAVCIYTGNNVDSTYLALPLKDVSLSSDVRPAGYKIVGGNMFFILNEEDLVAGDYKITYEDVKAVGATVVSSV